MKYLLIPVSMFIWSVTAYYGLYYSVIGMAYIFSFNWFTLLIGFPFIIGIASGITNGIPGILRLLMLKYFGVSWLACIAHAIAGLVAIIFISQFWILNPPELLFGDKPVFILTGMWRVAPFKTIFLFMPFLGLMISLIWSTTFAPIFIKMKLNLDEG